MGAGALWMPAQSNRNNLLSNKAPASISKLNEVQVSESSFLADPDVSSIIINSQESENPVPSNSKPSKSSQSKNKV